MPQSPNIEHLATVVAVCDGRVRVSVEVGEACGSCASRRSCVLGASDERFIDVRCDDAASYTVGEQVVVAAHRRVGLLAVVLCYVVPLVVLGMILIVSLGMGMGEGAAALCALCATGCYYGVLSLFHGKISKRVTFIITKR